VARSGYASRPGRALFSLVALLAVIFGAIGAGSVWSDAQWTPKLALDLEGGTEIILTPVPQAGEAGKITDTQVAEAVNIIRQRVNSTGVSEAEVTTQGSQNIVVALPGNPDEKTRNLVKQSAELSFRPVLVEAAAQEQPQPTGTPSPGASPGATPGATPSATPSNGATLGASPTPSADRHAAGELTRVPRAGATTPATEPSPSESAPAGATPKPTNASDLSQITPAIEQEFTALKCDDLETIQTQVQDPAKVLVTCSQDGLAKYILGPVEVRGTDIKSASAGLGTNQQGFSTGEWQVNLEFNGEGTKKFADVTTRLAALTGAQNQFAIVLDRLVVSAPRTNERIPTGQAQISGNFTQDSAQTLANQLKFGALPISFRVETEDQISALLGGQQLQRGLLAGLIGLLLVVVYSLLQYRALGLVTVFSLVAAGVITYGLVVLLGWRQGFRLSLSGVAGLIVAIGITADSFIVYFERVRDEVRDGRSLLAAAESGWARARRTILASDTVSFLAAVVLFILAVGGVRGFAFTLGLTTLVDVIVVFLFTKPLVTLLARTKFFDGGHRMSGFSAEQLGRSPAAYAGRGRVRQPAEATAGAGGGRSRSAAKAGEPARPAGQSIAARRAAAEREADPTAVRSGKDA
jgi:preprotein translocase subunit SecD